MYVYALELGRLRYATGFSDPKMYILWFIMPSGPEPYGMHYVNCDKPQKGIYVCFVRDFHYKELE